MAQKMKMKIYVIVFTMLGFIGKAQDPGFPGDGGDPGPPAAPIDNWIFPMFLVGVLFTYFISKDIILQYQIKKKHPLGCFFIKIIIFDQKKCLKIKYGCLLHTWEELNKII